MTVVGKPAGSLAAFERAQKALSRRDLHVALMAFEAAEIAGANPDLCAGGRWTAHMLRGDLEAAWRESDAIRSRNAPDPHRFWTGESIDGKRVIVRCLHGLGDAVQMLRFLPWLRASCSYLIVEVPPRLLPLMPYMPGADKVITWGEQAPAVSPSWEMQVEVMELPYLLRTTLADLPVASHYLSLPAELVHKAAWQMPASRRARVGLVWAASEWDPTRCLPMTCLKRVLAVQGVEFWSLQGGKQQHDSSALQNIHDAADLGDGLVPLAAMIANMDLIITVDTLAAHMAGAMGRQAWVLLQHTADWRWMHEGTDSPWYPTLRLRRQQTQDDWNGLTTEICEALQAWAKS